MMAVHDRFRRGSSSDVNNISLRFCGVKAADRHQLFRTGGGTMKCAPDHPGRRACGQDLDAELAINGVPTAQHLAYGSNNACASRPFRPP